MHGRTSYPAAQIALARKEFGDLATVWRSVSAASTPRAQAEAEVQVFNQMVVALDRWIDGRIEGASPPAVVEVRLLARGITVNAGRFPEDRSIHWKPDASITGYQVGDRIALTEALFSRLADVVMDNVARHARAMA